VVVDATILAVGRSDAARVVVDVSLIGLTLFFSVLIFYFPMMGGHRRLLAEKREELSKINKKSDNLLDVMEKNLDVGIIGEEGEEMIVDPADLLVRLEFMAHSNYYNHVLKMRDWPIDNNIIYRSIFSILFPILLGILSYYIESILF
jgi:hypothetical protein